MDPYILMLVALAGLAVLDLVVGVSNDAVNFLNSAIGSKAFPLRTIMIIASIGVFFGAVSSSGMMEIARSGIFNPRMFVFEDVMTIFMAVMITDVLLLDIFNSLGMPTSTTVSIVFELLGASVCIAILKITASSDHGFAELVNYINHEKAVRIVSGILLSVVISFTVGAFVQYVSRLLFTFDFQKRPNYVNVLFGGFAITSITFFILFKGLKGTPFYGNIKHIFEGGNIYAVILGVWLTCLLLSYALIKLFKVNILVVTIGLGVFSLAVAFSGNDLVNFIGVPMAALNSYQVWSGSGVDAGEFVMTRLATDQLSANTYLLLLAGLIMVVTLWTSKKTKNITETEVNLARQDYGDEKFEATEFSRIIVKTAILIHKGISKLLTKRALIYIERKFRKPVIKMPQDKTYELPAFDLVRAAVNLVVASILISMATSLKLPLSTTYVTFMVAMGTSLADRAWGRDSAVYRVAGVLNVIAGWFLTAVIAFFASCVVAYLISWSKLMVPVLLLVLIAMLVRNSIMHAKREQEKAAEQEAKREEIKTIKGVIRKSSEHISKVAKRVNKLYTNVVEGLGSEDLLSLKKNDKLVMKLNKDIDSLREGVFYFIKSLDDSSLKASKFYILTLSYLQDIAQSVDYISKSSFKHVNNNHKQLTKSQINDLKAIDKKLETILGTISVSFKDGHMENLHTTVKQKKDLLFEVNRSIEKQITRISRTEESSPKNATLYFGVLLETKDLITSFLDMLEMYEEFSYLTQNRK